MTAPDSRSRGEPRPASPLRCATCHDDLGEQRDTCSGCGVHLHPDCRLELDRCPTLGCGPQVGLRVDPKLETGPTFRQAHPVRYHLVWLVPALISAAWPLLFLAGAVVRRATAERPIDDLSVLLFALATMSPGFLVGHLVLAPRAGRCGDRGSPHLRAALGAGIAVLISTVLFFLWLRHVLSQVDWGW